MLENKPQYIDIHSHVNFEAFKEDRDEVVKRALNNKTWMINVGTQIGTSKSAVALAEKYDKGVYAIVGLHPVHTDKSYHDERSPGFFYNMIHGSDLSINNGDKNQKTQNYDKGNCF